MARVTMSVDYVVIGMHAILGWTLEHNWEDMCGCFNFQEQGKVMIVLDMEIATTISSSWLVACVRSGLEGPWPLHFEHSHWWKRWS